MMEVMAWEETVCKPPPQKKQTCLSLVFAFVGENMSLNSFLRIVTVQ